MKTLLSLLEMCALGCSSARADWSLDADTVVYIKAGAVVAPDEDDLIQSQESEEDLQALLSERKVFLMRSRHKIDVVGIDLARGCFRFRLLDNPKAGELWAAGGQAEA